MLEFIKKIKNAVEGVDFFINISLKEEEGDKSSYDLDTNIKKPEYVATILSQVLSNWVKKHGLEPTETDKIDNLNMNNLEKETNKAQKKLLKNAKKERADYIG